MPTLPSQSWSPGLPEKGDVGNCLCLNSSHQSHGGKEGSDPVSQASLASGPRQNLLSPGQWWVSENAAFHQVCPALLLPHLPCLPLAPLVLCSLATVFILKVPQKWGVFSLHPLGYGVPVPA